MTNYTNRTILLIVFFTAFITFILIYFSERQRDSDVSVADQFPAVTVGDNSYTVTVNNKLQNANVNNAKSKKRAPVWLVKHIQSNGQELYRYFFPSIITRSCVSSKNVGTGAFSISNKNCETVNNPEKETAWKRNVYEAFFGVLTNPGTQQSRVVTLMQGENKNEKGSKNTINTSVEISKCASKANSSGNYSECMDAYNAFVGIGHSSLNITNESGGSNIIDLGPIVWPSNGYLNQDDSKASFGVRYPSGIIHNNHLYVFYVDSGLEKGNVRVVRAPIGQDGVVRPNDFRLYKDNNFETRSLPQGFDKDNIENFYKTKIAKGKNILPYSFSADPIRFSVARVKGKNLFIGVEEYVKNATGNFIVAIRFSQNLLNWSEPVEIYKTTNGWNKGKLHYPILADRIGTHNTEIDLERFFIHGTDISNKISKLRISIEETPGGGDDVGVACGPMDSNNDNKITLPDFANFAKVYNKNCNDTKEQYATCGPKDYNKDGRLNLSDFANFASKYNKANCN